MSDDQLSVMEQYIAGRLNVLTRKTSAQIAASPEGANRSSNCG